MDTLLFLLLELNRAQLQLNQMQSARSARSEISAPRTRTVAKMPTVSKPSAAPSATVTQNASPAPHTSAPTVAPSQTSGDFRTQVEQFVLEETNAARAQNGLGALTNDSLAASIARGHSQDMLSKNYFSHTNQSGCNAGCRLTNGGYVWRSYGENIHWMSGYNLSARDSAKKIVNDWMNSPGHRANILGNFKYAGVGIAVEGSKIYSTTVYTTK